MTKKIKKLNGGALLIVTKYKQGSKYVLLPI